MSLLEVNPRAHAGHTTDFIYHSLLFAAVMIVFVLVSLFAGSWAWMIPALLGWGMVILGQAAYVFLWEAGGADSTLDKRTIQTLVSESRKITPGA